MNYTRQDFLRTLGLGLASGAALSAAPNQSASTKQSKNPLKLGIASYTLKDFSLEQAIGMTKRLGLQHIALKSMHLPLEASPEEIKAAAAKVREAGLDLYGAGVIYMKTEAEVNQAF